MNIIKRILQSIFGSKDMYNINEEGSNGYREYKKTSASNKKNVPTKTCYAADNYLREIADSYGCNAPNNDYSHYGSCASFGSGQHNVAIGHQSAGLTESCNDRFIESHFEN